MGSAPRREKAAELDDPGNTRRCLLACACLRAMTRVFTSPAAKISTLPSDDVDDAVAIDVTEIPDMILQAPTARRAIPAELCVQTVAALLGKLSGEIMCPLR